MALEKSYASGFGTQHDNAYWMVSGETVNRFERSAVVTVVAFASADVRAKQKAAGAAFPAARAALEQARIQHEDSGSLDGLIALREKQIAVDELVATINSSKPLPGSAISVGLSVGEVADLFGDGGGLNIAAVYREVKLRALPSALDC